MKKEKLYHICIIMLLILWIPTLTEKVLNFNRFKSDMLSQPFDDNLAPWVFYSIPLLEGGVILLLIKPAYQRLGLILSSILLLIFTVYVSSAILGMWERIPCGCGLIISGMSWHQHFFFNVCFLLISILGLYLHQYQKIISTTKFLKSTSASNF